MHMDGAHHSTTDMAIVSVAVTVVVLLIIWMIYTCKRMKKKLSSVEKIPPSLVNIDIISIITVNIISD